MCLGRWVGWKLAVTVLRGGEWNARNVYIFLPIYIRSGTGDINKNLISAGEFYENQRNERPTLLKGFSE